MIKGQTNYDISLINFFNESIDEKLRILFTPIIRCEIALIFSLLDPNKIYKNIYEVKSDLDKYLDKDFNLNSLRNIIFNLSVLNLVETNKREIYITNLGKLLQNLYKSLFFEFLRYGDNPLKIFKKIRPHSYILLAKLIYILANLKDGELISLTDINTKLNANLEMMVRKLSQIGFVHYKKYSNKVIYKVDLEKAKELYDELKIGNTIYIRNEEEVLKIIKYLLRKKEEIIYTKKLYEEIHNIYSIHTLQKAIKTLEELGILERLNNKTIIPTKKLKEFFKIIEPIYNIANDPKLLYNYQKSIELSRDDYKRLLSICL